MLNDALNIARPPQLDAILADTAALGFTMQCEDKTGALLRLLAATKPEVRPGGYYVVDDLLPQANWPNDDHPLKVRELVSALQSDSRFQIVSMNWASGLVVCVRKAG